MSLYPLLMPNTARHIFSMRVKTVPIELPSFLKSEIKEDTSDIIDNGFEIGED